MECEEEVSQLHVASHQSHLLSRWGHCDGVKTISDVKNSLFPSNLGFKGMTSWKSDSVPFDTFSMMEDGALTFQY